MTDYKYPPDCQECGRELFLVEYENAGVGCFICPDCEPHRIPWSVREENFPELLPLKKKCEICRVCRSAEGEVTHHVSYFPEVTTPVCWSCHWKIHNIDGFEEDLTPDISRSEAENKGFI